MGCICWRIFTSEEPPQQESIFKLRHAGEGATIRQWDVRAPPPSTFDSGVPVAVAFYYLLQHDVPSKSRSGWGCQVPRGIHCHSSDLWRFRDMRCCGCRRRSFVARAEGQREGVETELEGVGIAKRRKKKEKEKNYEATHINLRTWKLILPLKDIKSKSC